MSLVRFIDPAGVVYDVNAAPGQSVMMAAVVHGVPGMVAECGGNLTCATCHVYVDEQWRDLIGSPTAGSDEDAMLDLTSSPREPGSRLSCQVAPPDVDGVEFRIAPEQM